jgi:aspartate/methionine/tyrosine aminotransferase
MGWEGWEAMPHMPRSRRPVQPRGDPIESPAMTPRFVESMRMRSVQSPVIPVVGELIRRHPGTISLGQGVVFYGPPAEAVGQIAQFLSDPENHKYKAVHGVPPLLERFDRKLRGENGIALGESRRLVVTAGGNMAFMNAVLAVADPGDEVILPVPYYFNHEMAVRIAGCTPVLVATDERYQLRVDAIRGAITRRTRAVVTISPNNPTGAVYPEAALREVNALCRDRGVYHVNDEAYEYFTYGGARHFSPGSIADGHGHTISLFSLSKAYGFASWRIGAMVIPADLFDAVRKIQDTILICPPVVSQYAAVGAMGAGRAYCERHKRVIEDVREMVLEALAGLGSLVRVPPADGAFYFLVRLETDMPAMRLVESLIRDFGVAVIPGDTFGVEGQCVLRVSYGALEKDTAAEGIGRLVKGLRALVRR